MTTPEELKQARIGLAEWMGWERWINPDKSKVRLSKPRDETQRLYWVGCGCATTDAPLTEPLSEIVPEFTRDPNALRSVLERMTEEQFDRWLLTLADMLGVCTLAGGSFCIEPFNVRKLFSSPVEQQAIAAFKVIQEVEK